MHLPIFSPDFTRFCDVFSDVCSTLASCSTLVIVVKRTGGIRGLKTIVYGEAKTIEKKL